MSAVKKKKAANTRQNHASDDRKPLTACLNLQEIALNSCSLNVERALVDLKGKLSMEFNVNTNFEGDEFIARCTCTITGETVDDEKPLLNLKAEYLVRYECSERHDWPSAEVNYFAQRNVILHIWPYFREFIDHLTKRANIPRILLPLAPGSAIPPRK